MGSELFRLLRGSDISAFFLHAGVAENFDRKIIASEEGNYLDADIL